MSYDGSPEFKNVDEFFKWHASHAPVDHQRLGQRFVNLYIKGQWPDLFYCVSEPLAKQTILTWLADHQYVNCMPQKIGSGRA